MICPIMSVMSRIVRTTVLSAAALGVLAFAAPAASADGLGDPATGTASCMGAGASFYGTFAPQQMAFVAESVVIQDGPAGAVFSVFGQEKEGGAIPSPCGTRLE
jgi:hypothetical protein